jgi:hypothetical protein
MKCCGTFGLAQILTGQKMSWVKKIMGELSLVLKEPNCHLERTRGELTRN